MKRFLYWTSMVILWVGCLWGAYGIRETYRGTDLILAGRTAEAREVFLRASAGTAIILRIWWITVTPAGTMMTET